MSVCFSLASAFFPRFLRRRHSDSAHGDPECSVGVATIGFGDASGLRACSEKAGVSISVASMPRFHVDLGVMIRA